MSSAGGGLARLVHWFHRHLLTLLLVSSALAALVPGPGLWLRGAAVAEGTAFGATVRLTTPALLLALLLFSAGLGAGPAAAGRRGAAGGAGLRPGDEQ